MLWLHQGGHAGTQVCCSDWRQGPKSGVIGWKAVEMVCHYLHVRAGASERRAQARLWDSAGLCTARARGMEGSSVAAGPAGQIGDFKLSDSVQNVENIAYRISAGAASPYAGCIAVCCTHPVSQRWGSIQGLSRGCASMHPPFSVPRGHSCCRHAVLPCASCSFCTN